MRRDTPQPVDLAGRECGTRQAGSVSLPVLKPKIRKSRMGWKRAIVLASIYVVFLIHLAQWYFSGMSDGVRETISPIEPSESMYTLEMGKVNAGFVFFAAAIVSTVLFGRFFCGWGCHIVALQDLCAWAMKKAGIHPKPFRSRLMILMPLFLACYMFIWPTFKREALEPLVNLVWGADAYNALEPFIGGAPPRPDFESHFVVENLWETFAPWYIAIPFLGICGFATVYFLGSKGFCTYGCPYGGFFAPLDKISVGRIVVNDNCEQCGHCTATCTSNVRVHEEVRDFGQVVDPGCMKCLDCVSVCPNHALSFSFGKPSLFTAPRTEPAKQRRRAFSANYDLSWPEEAVLALLFLFLTMVGFRGMFDSTPLLMSAGLASIATFGAWKLWRLVFTPNVRLAHWQIRAKGRVTPAGWAFIPIAVAFLALAVWGATVRIARETGNYWDFQVHASPQQVFGPAYLPDPTAKANALRAIECFTEGDAPSRGGIGWPLKEEVFRLPWLHAVAGDRDAAVAAQERAVEIIADRARASNLKLERAKRHANLSDAILRLADLRTGRGDSREAIQAMLRERAIDEPGLGALHIALARGLALGGDTQDIDARIAHAIQLDHVKGVPFEQTLANGADLLASTGRVDAARALLDRELPNAFKPAIVESTIGRLLASTNKATEARVHFRSACDLEPRNPAHWLALADALQRAGRTEEAQTALNEGIAKRPRSVDLRAALGRLLLATRRPVEAVAQFQRWVDLAPAHAEPHLALADAYRAQSKPAEVARVLLIAIKHRSRDVLIRLVAADALIASGQPAQALPHIETAVRLEPVNPTIRERAAILFDAAGRPDRARALRPSAAPKASP